MAMFCNHDQTEMIARRQGVDYVRCKDCGQVFEADDLELLRSQPEDEEKTPVR
jgi:transcription elongation factor Elf1